MTLSNYLLFLLILVFNVSNSTTVRNSEHISHGNSHKRRHNHNQDVDLNGYYDNHGYLDLAQPVNLNPSYSYQNCTQGTQCHVNRAERKRRRIENIKAQILQHMGLEAPPNITKHRNVSSIAGFNMFNNAPTFRGHNNEENYKLNEIYKFATRPPEGEYYNKNRLHFSFSDISKSSKVLQANLKFFIRRTSPNGHFINSISINVYKVRNLAINIIKTFQLEVRGREQWVEFNVTNLVRRSVKSGKNLTLDIKIVRKEDVDEFELVNSDENDNSNYPPQLYINTKEHLRSRNKRRTSGLVCSEKSKESRCCRWPLKVNFNDFGWYFIIQPRTYHANYCDGTCAVSSGLTRYQHSHIVLQAQGFQSCCIATKMNSLDMIFYKDEDTIMQGTIADMIAERCQCA